MFTVQWILLLPLSCRERHHQDMTWHTSVQLLETAQLSIMLYNKCISVVIGEDWLYSSISGSEEERHQLHGRQMWRSIHVLIDNTCNINMVSERLCSQCHAKRQKKKKSNWCLCVTQVSQQVTHDTRRPCLLASVWRCTPPTPVWQCGYGNELTTRLNTVSFRRSLDDPQIGGDRTIAASFFHCRCYNLRLLHYRTYINLTPNLIIFYKLGMHRTQIHFC